MNSLLEHVMTEMLLQEGKLDQAKEKFPQFTEDLDQLASSEELRTYTKYIDWFCKRKLEGEPTDELLDLLVGFERNIQRLERKDINRYSSLADLRDAIEQLGTSKRQLRSEIPWWLVDLKDGVGDAEKIYEDDKSLVYYIPTREASVYYGKGTKWCISATGTNMFDSYTKSQGNQFFFIISKDLEATEQYRKVALQVKSGEIVGFWTADDVNYGQKISSLTLLRSVLGLSRSETRSIESSILYRSSKLSGEETRLTMTMAAKAKMLIRQRGEEFIDSINEILAIFENRPDEGVYKSGLDYLIKVLQGIEMHLEDEEVDALEEAVNRYLSPEMTLRVLQRVPGLDAKRFENKFLSGDINAAKQYFQSVPGANVKKFGAGMLARVNTAQRDSEKISIFKEALELYRGKKLSQQSYDELIAVISKISPSATFTPSYEAGFQYESVFVNIGLPLLVAWKTDCSGVNIEPSLEALRRYLYRASASKHTYVFSKWAEIKDERMAVLCLDLLRAPDVWADLLQSISSRDTLLKTSAKEKSPTLAARLEALKRTVVDSVIDDVIAGANVTKTLAAAFKDPETAAYTKEKLTGAGLTPARRIQLLFAMKALLPTMSAEVRGVDTAIKQLLAQHPEAAKDIKINSLRGMSSIWFDAMARGVKGVGKKGVYVNPSVFVDMCMSALRTASESLRVYQSELPSMASTFERKVRSEIGSEDILSQPRALARFQKDASDLDGAGQIYASFIKLVKQLDIGLGLYVRAYTALKKQGRHESLQKAGSDVAALFYSIVELIAEYGSITEIAENMSARSLIERWFDRVAAEGSAEALPILLDNPSISARINSLQVRDLRDIIRKVQSRT